MQVPMSAIDKKRLTKRYLLWCYKTTKEELDKIDRKFTQLEVDYYMLKQLERSKKSVERSLRKEYLEKVDGFKEYIRKKEQRAGMDASSKKVSWDADYLYLKNRLQAIEQAIQKFFGKKELDLIKKLYQDEMVKRILEAKEHT